MDTFQEPNLEQASRAEETTKDIKKKDPAKLLEWIQKKLPNLLDDKDDLKAFQKARISGSVFLRHAGEVGFFKNECGLSIGVSEDLAYLPAEVFGSDTVGMKRDRQQAGDVEMSDAADMKKNRQQAGDAEMSDTAYESLQTVAKLLTAFAGGGTAGIKRNIQQARYAEMSDTASKKLRAESEASQLQRLAASACRQRERIRQDIEKLDPLIVPSLKNSKESKPTNIVSQLSNPAYETKLPFPFVGDTNANRFEVDKESDEKYWRYMGREKFANLIDEFENIRRDPGYTVLHVYGTRGYGKSHLLAALVCVLAAWEVKVVYIPDCRELIRSPVSYVRAAMLFAWTGDESKQQNIMALENEEDIYRFFENQVDVIFVVDQLNALDIRKTDDRRTADKKADLYQWLDRCMACHKAILSSSANNHKFLNAVIKHPSQKMMYVYGGLTETEMTHWWEWNHQVKLDDDTRKKAEDFTGRIPLFLKMCVVKGKNGEKDEISLENEFFRQIFEEAAGFEANLQNKYKKDPDKLRRHYSYMIGALYNKTVPWSSRIIPNLVDHRYFYDKVDDTGRVGYHTCGVSCKAVFPMLLSNKVLAGGTILQSLSGFIHNSSVTEYMIEQAVLAWIAFYGLNLPRLRESMEVRVFHDPVPNLKPKTNRPVLHIPQIFNYKAIDGVIVKKEDPASEGNKQRLFIYPLQITVAEKHEDSHKTFFDQWEKWIANLGEFDVIPEFIWITKEGGEEKRHLQTGQWPAHKERNISISEVNKHIGMMY